jgi:DNA repair exonuclease SbcCD ATPase subunit
LLIATGAVLMVKVIKSAVKCYKKKTKKTVGGKRKIYEYNQYLVPLKRSDKFECSEEVFIIPQRQIKELVGEDISMAEEYLKNLGVNDSNFEAYERELAELEWKHNELSKSYKELVSKHTKTNKKLRIDDERLKNLEEDKKKLMNKLEEVSSAYKTLKTNYELESKKNKVLEDELNKDKDIWTSLKSRLGSKKDGEGE